MQRFSVKFAIILSLIFVSLASLMIRGERSAKANSEPTRLQQKIAKIKNLEQQIKELYVEEQITDLGLMVYNKNEDYDDIKNKFVLLRSAVHHDEHLSARYSAALDQIEVIIIERRIRELDEELQNFNEEE